MTNTPRELKNIAVLEDKFYRYQKFLLDSCGWPALGWCEHPAVGGRVGWFLVQARMTGWASEETRTDRLLPFLFWAGKIPFKIPQAPRLSPTALCKPTPSELAQCGDLLVSIYIHFIFGPIRSKITLLTCSRPSGHPPLMNDRKELQLSFLPVTFCQVGKENHFTLLNFWPNGEVWGVFPCHLVGMIAR